MEIGLKCKMGTYTTVMQEGCQLSVLQTSSGGGDDTHHHYIWSYYSVLTDSQMAPYSL